MEISDYVKITTSDGVSFILPRNHILLQKGIFQCTDLREPIYLHSCHFIHLVFYQCVQKKDLLEMIQLIIPYSIPIIQDFYLKTLLSCLDEDLKNDILQYHIDIIDIIEHMESLNFETLVQKIRYKLSKNYSKNKSIILKMIKNGKYNIIYDYESFDPSIFDYLLKSSSDYSIFLDNTLIQYILDHSELLEKENNIMQPIHYLCRYSTPEMIKYIIDKGVNLECEVDGGIRPIHYLCRFSTPEMIKYIIDQGVNLECETKDKIRPIFLICKFSTPEMLRYIIEKGADMEKNFFDLKIIYLLIRTSSLESIQYIVEKGIDLEYENDNKIKPIHQACSDSTPEIIQYIVDQGVNLECETKSGWRPIHFLCKKSTPEMIRYVVEKGVDLHCKNMYQKKPIDYLKERFPDLIEWMLQKMKEQLENVPSF